MRIGRYPGPRGIRPRGIRPSGRLDRGRVRLQLKRAFSDGTFAIEMDELSLVARVAAIVPTIPSECTWCETFTRAADGHMSIHPLRGREHEVVGTRRDLRARVETVVAQAPDGGCMVPVPSDPRESLASKRLVSHAGIATFPQGVLARKRSNNRASAYVERSQTGSVAWGDATPTLLACDPTC